jgi:succinate dehydrogenase / fumarate reductase, cytochrome b subunit
MAEASNRVASRPLSPHMSIWRWGPGMIVSILHRATGIGLTIGLGIFIWWLAALAAGPDAYARFAEHATSWYGLIVLVGVSWSFFAHTVTGIRHFVLDAGAGYELTSNNRWAALTIPIGILLTAAFWALLLLR